MTGALTVWIEGLAVGELSNTEGAWQLEYRSEWLGHEDGFGLSPHRYPR